MPFSVVKLVDQYFRMKCLMLPKIKELRHFKQNKEVNKLAQGSDFIL